MIASRLAGGGEGRNIIKENRGCVSDHVPDVQSARRAERAELKRSRMGTAKENRNKQQQELLAAKIQRMQRREQEREHRRRQQVLEQRQRGWIKIVMLASRIHTVAGEIESQREWRKEHAIRNVAAVRMQNAFKKYHFVYSLRKRAFAIRVFRKAFWRLAMRLKIRRLRRASYQVREFLQDAVKSKKAVNGVRLFRMKVIKVQRFWKKELLIFRCQNELLIRHWRRLQEPKKGGKGKKGKGGKRTRRKSIVGAPGLDSTAQMNDPAAAAAAAVAASMGEGKSEVTVAPAPSGAPKRAKGRRGSVIAVPEEEDTLPYVNEQLMIKHLDLDLKARRRKFSFEYEAWRNAVDAFQEENEQQIALAKARRQIQGEDELPIMELMLNEFGDAVPKRPYFHILINREAMLVVINSARAEHARIQAAEYEARAAAEEEAAGKSEASKPPLE